MLETATCRLNPVFASFSLRVLSFTLDNTQAICRGGPRCAVSFCCRFRFISVRVLTYHFYGRFYLYLGNLFISVGGICLSFSLGIYLGGVLKDIYSTMDESPFLARLCSCQTKDICDQLVDDGLFMHA